MPRIQIISASAGSGKTYRLASVLDAAIADGSARPDAVLATTFTNRAAAELKERTRTRLLQAGRVEEAHRLGAARIGTVNAVCGRLVGDFAFELGLAPDLRVIDERAATVALRQAMSRVVTGGETARLADVKRRFDETWEWQADVQRIVTLARANGVAADDLARTAERSVAGLLALFAPPAVDGRALDAALADALARFLSEVNVEVDATQKTQKAIDKAERCLGRLRRGLPLRWADWYRLQDLDAGKKSERAAAPLVAAAGAHDRHPDLQADLRASCELVYAIAARTLRAYEDYKRAWGAIDFTDQEVFALTLLDRADVRARLTGEIDLVLVDEFQDTSPLQLAIFLRLAEVAKRSVWVGDQKQSIFGFRGTDPALMDAAVESILAGAEPETLATSWRSRPGLVALTSDVFAKSFAGHGVPESRVRLEAAAAEEDPGLGPVVERWRLPAKNQLQDAAYLASAVCSLLADSDVRVRDRASGDVRPLRAGDVAVLCYQNATCASLARELAALGVRAVLARAGLMTTPEALLVLAGLRLFVDARDTLAMAELARLVAYPASGDGWLADLVARPAREAFAELAVVRRVAEARAAAPHAGALAALDAVLDAVEARERCLEWGDAAFRLANLDALRAHAVTYASLCAADGRGCTPAGLVAAFVDLAASGLDARAVVAQEDAVVVSTWHSAKGLEWPVTVLFDLDRDPYFTALGVQVVADRAALDVADPLAERWVRYWPQPYHPMQQKTPFHQRLREAPETEAARQREERQAMRLLYVGWTRARDRVVLAGRPACLAFGMVAQLRDAKGKALLAEAPSPMDGPTADLAWAGRPVTVRVRDVALLGPAPRDAAPGVGYVAAGPRTHPPAILVPSEMEPPDRFAEDGTPIDPAADAARLGIERCGERLVLGGKPDMQRLGEAVHGFLAADRPTLDERERREMADGLLKRWGVETALRPDDLLDASDRLRAWVEARFPGSVWHREWPLQHRQPDGTIVRGTADLVIEHSGGFAVIDHKSFPGTAEQAAHRAVAYTGQLAAYAAAVTAARGRPVTGCFVHLPVLGAIVPMVP
ncbi:MAG: UvrD-helicase domain-containing protein [Deltaproteobacteria bacterium]|nr:UvrD-helicase domain-containing protein [Deltaproteobacteria bacterium]